MHNFFSRQESFFFVGSRNPNENCFARGASTLGNMLFDRAHGVNLNTRSTRNAFVTSANVYSVTTEMKHHRAMVCTIEDHSGLHDTYGQDEMNLGKLIASLQK